MVPTLRASGVNENEKKEGRQVYRDGIQMSVQDMSEKMNINNDART